MLKLLDVLKHASQCRATKAEPCSYANCSQIKKLFSHARRCEIRVNRGCQHCKKIWFILIAHSRNCKDSECRIPRCRCVAVRILHHLIEFERIWIFSFLIYSLAKLCINILIPFTTVIFLAKLCINTYFFIFILILQGSEEAYRIESNAFRILAWSCSY